jgi:hypothetical protein
MQRGSASLSKQTNSSCQPVRHAAASKGSQSSWTAKNPEGQNPPSTDYAPPPPCVNYSTYRPTNNSETTQLAINRHLLRSAPDTPSSSSRPVCCAAGPCSGKTESWACPGCHKMPAGQKTLSPELIGSYQVLVCVPRTRVRTEQMQCVSRPASQPASQAGRQAAN